MRKTAIILTLLLAVLLCQTAAADVPDVRLFRSLVDAGLDVDALLAQVPTLEELGIDKAEFARGYPYHSEAAEAVSSEALVYYQPETGALDCIRLRDFTLESGCAFDDLYYRFDSKSFDGMIERENGPLAAMYNSMGWMTGYFYDYSDELRMGFDSNNNVQWMQSSDGAYTEEDVLAFALELVGDPFDPSSYDSLAPDIRVYGNLQAAGIDPEALLNAVPYPGPLQSIKNYVVIEDHGYVDAWISYEDVSHGFQGGNLPDNWDYWWLGNADEKPWDGPGNHIKVGILDEQGNKISATWDLDSGSLTELEVLFAQADPEGYTSLTLNAERNQFTLSAPGCQARYRTSGALNGYSYDALDGTQIRYAASGQRTDGGDPSTASLYPPLEIIRAELSGNLAPNAKVFATLDATGVDPTPYLGIIPQDSGAALEDGILTLPDRGYDEVMVYNSSEDRAGSLKDGVWTVDCNEMSTDDGDLILWVVFPDEQGNFVSADYDGLSTLGYAYVGFSRKLAGGFDSLSFAYTDDGLEVSIGDSDVIATYDSDGKLLFYEYTALDGAYVSYDADNALIEIWAESFDADGNWHDEEITDATSYPPLEIIAE